MHLSLYIADIDYVPYRRNYLDETKANVKQMLIASKFLIFT